MTKIVLLRIESMQARAVEEAGIKIKYNGHEILTGPIVAQLDDSARLPANTGMIDLDAGEIQLNWKIVAGMPFLADAFASGTVPLEETGPVRILFDEYGKVLPDGCGFDVEGTGHFDPGSVLSSTTIIRHSNKVRIRSTRRKATFVRSIANGESVWCALSPESYMDVALAKSLGGGTHRLHLVGGFLMVPVMTLGRAEPTRRKR